MAISDYNPVEQERLGSLANEYRSSGYEVDIYPCALVLPLELRGFIIGLAAKKDEELVFAEVRTRDRLGLCGKRDLRAIAEGIEDISNADWELIVISSRKDESQQPAIKRGSVP